MENTTISSVYGSGRRKLFREKNIATTPTPGLKIDARPTTEDNPKVITVEDQNSNPDLSNSENTEPTDKQNEQNIRKSTR